MGLEGDAIFGDFAEFAETEDLEPTGVGEDGAVPRHELVDATEFADLLDTWAQIEMVGVVEQNLYAEFFEHVLGNAFDSSERSDGHEHRGLDRAMGRNKASGSRGTGGGFQLEGKGHCVDCKWQVREASP